MKRQKAGRRRQAWRNEKASSASLLSSSGMAAYHTIKYYNENIDDVISSEVSIISKSGSVYSINIVAAAQRQQRLWIMKRKRKSGENEIEMSSAAKIWRQYNEISLKGKRRKAAIMWRKYESISRREDIERREKKKALCHRYHRRKNGNRRRKDISRQYIYIYNQYNVNEKPIKRHNGVMSSSVVYWYIHIKAAERKINGIISHVIGNIENVCWKE